MAGNGTIGLELVEDLDRFDAVLIPWGGGGLTTGIASAVKALRPETKVVVCEPETRSAGVGGDRERSRPGPDRVHALVHRRRRLGRLAPRDVGARRRRSSTTRSRSRSPTLRPQSACLPRRRGSSPRELPGSRSRPRSPGRRAAAASSASSPAETSTPRAWPRSSTAVSRTEYPRPPAPTRTEEPAVRIVSTEEARRIAVRAQLLDGSATTLLDTVRRLGFLQIDPISTVAPPQQLVPWSRLGPYDVAELDRLLWEEKKLFEWNAFIWPIESLPLVKARMRRRRTGKYAHERRSDEFLRANRAFKQLRPARARAERADALARDRGRRRSARGRRTAGGATAASPCCSRSCTAVGLVAVAGRRERAAAMGSRASAGFPRWSRSRCARPSAPRGAAFPRTWREADEERLGGAPGRERRARPRPRHVPLPLRSPHPRSRPRRGAVRLPLPARDVRAEGEARVRLLRPADPRRRPARRAASSHGSTGRRRRSRCSAPGETRPARTRRSTASPPGSAPDGAPRISGAMQFETRAIHDGQEPDPASGAITTPIYQTSTYVQEAVGVHKGYDYARVGNPTRTALQECIASLEGAAHGRAFSSGLGAATTLMHLLSPGDHVVAVNDVYGGIYRMFTQVYEPKGYRFTFLTAERDLDRARRASRGADEARLARDADEPRAQHRRHRGRGGGRARGRRAGRRRQHLRDAVPPAAARARRRRRPALDDEVPRRTFGRDRRLRRDERRRAGRAARVPAEVARRRARAVRRVARAARGEDARGAHGSALRQRRRRRGVPRATSRGLARPLPRPPLAPRPHDRGAADAELRRDGRRSCSRTSRRRSTSSHGRRSGSSRRASAASRASSSTPRA